MARGFRLAGTLNEFLKDLDVLKDQEHSLIVWQNDQNGEKQIFDGHYDCYVKERDNIIIHVKLEKNEVFDKDNSVYIFEKDKGILFKGRYEFCVNAILKVLADDKVFLKEKRSEDRFYFNYTDVSAQLHVHGENEAGGFEISLNLRDVCAGGFSFKAINKISKQFKPGMKLELKDVGGIELPRPIDGSISHISDFKDISKKPGTPKEKLVGVSFSQDSKLFAKVISVIREMN